MAETYITQQTYIEKLLNYNSGQFKSGRVAFTIPDAENSGTYHALVGLVEQDIKFKSGITWGSIMPDLQTLNEISQIVNSQNMVSWISSSTGSWKSTKPFEFDITFYLVTHSLDKAKQPHNIKEQASWLVKMCALHTTDFATARVHGGYTLNLIQDNEHQSASSYFTPDGKINPAHARKLTEVNDGLITMVLGDTMVIDKLLVQNVDITPSSVQVASGIPLYIKVDASFRTHRALLTEDIDKFLRLN